MGATQFRQHSLNVEGDFLHVIADLIGSVGVVISGALIVLFGWHIADPILSIFLASLILVSAWRLVAKVFNVLLEGVPDHIDVYSLCRSIEEEPGVTLIHDVHVWSISSGYDAMTAHVLVDPEYNDDLDPLLRRIRAIAKDNFGIAQSTIQVEQAVAGCDEDHHAGHLEAMRGAKAKRLFSLPLPF